MLTKDNEYNNIQFNKPYLVLESKLSFGHTNCYLCYRNVSSKYLVFKPEKCTKNSFLLVMELNWVALWRQFYLQFILTIY